MPREEIWARVEQAANSTSCVPSQASALFPTVQPAQTPAERTALWKGTIAVVAKSIRKLATQWMTGLGPQH